MKHLILSAICLSFTACSGGGSVDGGAESSGEMSEPVTAAPMTSKDADKTFTAKFPKLGEGTVVRFPGHDVRHHVRADDLPSQIALTELTLAPKTLGAPPHIHADEDEIFIVLTGQVHFLSGEDEVVGAAGTVASLPRGHFHGFWNPYDAPATMLLMIAPGHFEEFFEDVEKAVSEGGPKSPPEIGAIITQQAAARNVTVDMSKLPPSGLALLGPPPK